MYFAVRHSDLRQVCDRLKWKICIPCLVLMFISINLSAQTPAALQYHPAMSGWKAEPTTLFGTNSFEQKYWQFSLEAAPSPTFAELRWEVLDFQVEDLPVFCRLEVKLESAVRFPVKFRLGEVQYVERLEGKY